MNSLIFFDPSICSANMADNFITQICYEEISNLYKNSLIIKVSSHNALDDFSKFRIENSKFGIIGGTGIMSNCLPGKSNFQWKTEHSEINMPIAGMGIGFENNDIDLKKDVIEFYKRIFAENLISVRGEYTKQILESIGVNCINTGCPSLWDFSSFSSMKNKNVIFNLNSYRKVNHRQYYEILKNNYENVYFYAQHYLDVSTVREEFPEITPLFAPCNFVPLKDFCIKNQCDFIGTRVHSSIFLMKNKIRCIVVNTDCRTEEVIGQAGLPIAYNPDDLKKIINSEINCSILKEKKDEFSFSRNKWSKELKNRYEDI
jgi:hypothetical protein